MKLSEPCGLVLTDSPVSVLLCFSETLWEAITQIGGTDKRPTATGPDVKGFYENPQCDSTWSSQQRPRVFHTNTIRVPVIAAAEPLIIDR